MQIFTHAVTTVPGILTKRSEDLGYIYQLVFNYHNEFPLDPRVPKIPWDLEVYTYYYFTHPLYHILIHKILHFCLYINYRNSQQGSHYELDTLPNSQNCLPLVTSRWSLWKQSLI